MKDNDIIPLKHIVEEGVKDFYINNVLTPVDNVEFIEYPDNPFLDISPSGTRIYVQDIIRVIQDFGFVVDSGRRRSKYTLIVQNGDIKTYYNFILMSDGNLEFPGGFL